MPGINKQEGFNFKTGVYMEKKSFADYSPEEIEMYEKLISDAHANRQAISRDMQHYLNLKHGSTN